ncbi:MAG: hypothetical protein JST09_08440 [Bacteroidetes bacterium]|nr:hypothetical protein [Bacteroidota bacterium]MBS1610665.1 hypothetical protein [Bacteroidota bacterium]
MRRFTSIIITVLVLALLTFFSCKKQTDNFSSAPLSDYLPLVVGKYITYRLDSTVFLNFGKKMEVHSYQVKYEVNAEVQDNLGRPAYRIYRYIRDTTGTQSWAPDNTFFITPLETQIEYTEDNLRFIKLHLPIKDGYSWKGNMYLPDEPYASLFDFQNDNNMQDWDYFYDGDPQPSETINGQTFTDVLSVKYQEIPDANLTDTIPMTEPFIVERSFLSEKYSKNIGLVYKEYTMWDHQPNPTQNGGFDPFTNGFSIKMWMIDHN